MRTATRSGVCVLGAPTPASASLVSNFNIFLSTKHTKITKCCFPLRLTETVRPTSFGSDLPLAKQVGRTVSVSR